MARKWEELTESERADVEIKAQELAERNFNFSCRCYEEYALAENARAVLGEVGEG